MARRDRGKEERASDEVRSATRDVLEQRYARMQLEGARTLEAALAEAGGGVGVRR